MKLLTRQDYLIEEDGITYLARTGDTDPDNVLAPLQAASSTWRIAQGPRAGRKVLTLVGGTGNELREARQPRDVFCANAEDRQGIEQLCRYITRPAISNERLLRRNPDVSFGSVTARGLARLSGRTPQLTCRSTKKVSAFPSTSA